MNTLFRVLLAALCLIVGAYPLVYLLAEGKVGLLRLKSDAVLGDEWWRVGFYTHIVTGAVALFVGWTQFGRSWRKRHPRFHRLIGKLYVLMVLVSGVAAVCISFQASAGWVAAAGFGTLGVWWLYVTVQAYTRIRRRDLARHAAFMVYSYSLCMAAVTLRLWLPFLLGVLRLDFAVAYPTVAWLCWVPNLGVAHWIVRRMENAKTDSQWAGVGSERP